eukprot:TRINITY_DN66249_c0_g1_i1.p1 TRINITY_DN66249_c0_g1~~TRINITY_DN66249_c0_g1_i1.p1  ORF type:complete len:206 (+),score=15.94 TRINITY_DN66249_c0_g1_i1:29-619(+)
MENTSPAMTTSSSADGWTEHWTVETPKRKLMKSRSTGNFPAASKLTSSCSHPAMIPTCYNVGPFSCGTRHGNSCMCGSLKNGEWNHCRGACNRSTNSSSKQKSEFQQSKERGTPGHRSFTPDLTFFATLNSMRTSAPSSAQSVPGPGAYDDRQVPRDVVSPLRGEFVRAGKPRTTCMVTSLSTQDRFIDIHLQRRG